ncbi:hypothetical protein BST61_g223 [Cercospora zeina]
MRPSNMTENSKPLRMPPPRVSALNFYMQQARKAVPAAAMPPAPELPKSLDFDERLRLERAIAKSAALIEKSKARLNIRSVLPSELTASEAAGEDFVRAKEYSNGLTKKFHDYQLQRSQNLCVDVMQAIEDTLVRLIFIPPLSLLIKQQSGPSSPPLSPPPGTNRIEYMMLLARQKLHAQSQLKQKSKQTKTRRDRIADIISIAGQQAADEARFRIDVERCIIRTRDMIEAAQEALERQVDKKTDAETGPTVIDKWTLAKDFLALWEGKNSELPHSPTAAVAATQRKRSKGDGRRGSA